MGLKLIEIGYFAYIMQLLNLLDMTKIVFPKQNALIGPDFRYSLDAMTKLDRYDAVVVISPPSERTTASQIVGLRRLLPSVACLMCSSA